MNSTLKNDINNKEDAFITYNHENKALKFAYKKLLTAINEKLLKARRSRFNSAGRRILLGRKHCALIFMVMDKSLDSINVKDFDSFDADNSELKLWDLPIYVSMDDDYRIEIISSLGSLDAKGDLHLKEDIDKGLYFEPLISMEKLIDDLPDHMKIKRFKGE